MCANMETSWQIPFRRGCNGISSLWLLAGSKKENCAFCVVCTCQLHAGSLAEARALFGPQAKAGNHSRQQFLCTT